MHEVRWSRESVYDAADIKEYIELRFGMKRSDKFQVDIGIEVEKLGEDFSLYTDVGIGYRGYLI